MLDPPKNKKSQATKVGKTKPRGQEKRWTSSPKLPIVRLQKTFKTLSFLQPAMAQPLERQNMSSYLLVAFLLCCNSKKQTSSYHLVVAFVAYFPCLVQQGLSNAHFPRWRRRNGNRGPPTSRSSGRPALGRGLHWAGRPSPSS